MSRNVDLYDSAYGNYESATYRQVRIETYGEDFGQTSWVTTEESKAIPELLHLRSDAFVLEVGCGAGQARSWTAGPGGGLRSRRGP